MGQLIATFRKGNNLDLPMIRDKQLCFAFIMESGCNDTCTRRGKVETRPCSSIRLHLSLKDGDTEYTKAELQPLVTFLKNEQVAKHLVQTEALKKFMN